MNRISRAVSLILALALLSCQDSGNTVQLDGLRDIAGLEEFTQNGVHVQFKLQEDAGLQQYLSAIFAPTEPGFYLYGAELPEEGINGLGVPTGFKILNGKGAKQEGELFADQVSKSLHVEFLNIQLPVYEVGPVTLRMPIEIATGGKMV